jgi:arginine-tRNA-protein transferase
VSELERVRLYLSTEHVCGYLPGRSSRNAYIDPDFALNAQRYGWLLEQGFRRSGAHVYRPYCQHCRACIPARVPAASFTPNRAQRRCEARNADVDVVVRRRLGDEHFALYRRYLLARHADGGMDANNREGFHSFLECPWGEVRFWEFRAAGELLAVAVVDETPRGLSAVYTFFDPSADDRSLGTLAVLRQIAAARERSLGYVYLGYWVPGSRKMDYKKNFRPLEVLTTKGWETAP